MFLLLELSAYLLIFILGLMLGSYLNSWMWRIHNHKYVFGGRSICVHCSRQLTWYENIPLFSFIFLRGRCRTCHKPIPLDYFLVELGTAIVMLIIAVYFMNRQFVPWQAFSVFFFTAVLIVVFVYDLKYMMVLTGLAWLAAVVGALVNYFFLGFTLQSLLLGLIIGMGFFLAQFVVSKGEWIGGGDIRLGAMIGLWLGFPNIVLALFLSYILGAIVAVPLLLSKRKGMNSAVPFGTFLAVGTFITLLWGNQIVGWYLGMLK